jgi:hypothetical protein
VAEVANVDGGRIDRRWDASEGSGAMWRKDFDLLFERARRPDASAVTRRR